MRRLTSLLLCVLMVIALATGCSQEATAPTPEPTSAPTATAVPTPEPTPEPTAAPTPVPKPTYEPPTITVEDNVVDIGDGWITLTLPDQFEISDSEVGGLYSVTLENESSYAGVALQMMYREDEPTFTKEILNTYFETSATHDFPDCIAETITDVKYGDASGHITYLKLTLFDGLPIIRYHAVAVTDQCYYVLNIAGPSDGIIQDNEWVRNLIKSLLIDTDKEALRVQNRYQSLDSERTLTTPDAPIQIQALDNKWHLTPSKSLNDPRTILSGAQDETAYSFKVIQSPHFGVVTPDTEEFILLEHYLSLIINEIITPEDLETRTSKPIVGEEERLMYMICPNDEIRAIFVLLHDDTYSYVLQLTGTPENPLTDEIISEMVSSFRFTKDAPSR